MLRSTLDGRGLRSGHESVHLLCCVMADGSGYALLFFERRRGRPDGSRANPEREIRLSPYIPDRGLDPAIIEALERQNRNLDRNLWSKKRKCRLTPRKSWCRSNARRGT